MNYDLLSRYNVNCYLNGAPKILPAPVCYPLVWEMEIVYIAPTGFLRSTAYTVPPYLHGLVTRSVMKMWYELMRKRTPITEDDLDTTREGLVRCAKRVRDTLFAGVPKGQQPIETVYTPVRGGEIISAYHIKYSISRLMIVSIADTVDGSFGADVGPQNGEGKPIGFDWTQFEVPPDSMDRGCA